MKIISAPCKVPIRSMLLGAVSSLFLMPSAALADAIYLFNGNVQIGHSDMRLCLRHAETAVREVGFDDIRIEGTGAKDPDVRGQRNGYVTEVICYVDNGLMAISVAGPSRERVLGLRRGIRNILRDLI